MKRRAFWLMVGCVGVGLVLPVARASILIDGFSSAKNDRFANTTDFIAAGFDLSGIAVDDDGHWLAMISPNIYLSANHYHSAAGASVTFYASNDPVGSSVTRTISSLGQQIGSSDLWIGAISQPLPAGFAYYDFATQDIGTATDFTGSPLKGENAYMFGRSETETWPTSQDVAVGRNILDLWGSPDRVGATKDSFGTAHYVEHEARLDPGDSGGGMFVHDGSGGLTLVGINWGFSTLTMEGVTTYRSWFTYVGNYDAEIGAFLDTHPVPEPAGAAAIAALLAGFAVWRRSYRR